MEVFDLSTFANAPLLVDEITIDSRRIHSRNSLFVALSGEHFDGHDFVRAAFKAGVKACLVKKDFFYPDSTKMLIRVDDPLKALQDIASAYRKTMPAKVIGITGSFGKTMLKDLLFTLLEKQFCTFASPESFNSQLGVALSLLKMNSSHQIALIEAGISKEGEMKRLANMIQPDHAILTNVLPTKVAQEKFELLQAASGWSLGTEWNVFDPQLPEVYSLSSGEFVVRFPTKEEVKIHVHDAQRYVFDLLKIATRAAWLLGASAHAISEGLQSYTPEPMRIEVFKSSNGATFINDTYTEDPMSCDTALRQIHALEDGPSGRKIFVFGGLRPRTISYENDMAHLAHSIAKHKVDLVVITHPKSAHSLVSHLAFASPNTEVMVCKSEQSAFDEIKERLLPTDVVLVKGSHKMPVQELITRIEESLPNNQVIINLAVIQSNISEIRNLLKKDMRLMVMVKALAYGTDDVRISKFLKTCKVDILGVSYVDEGVQMRKAGVKQDIFVLNAAEYEASKLVRWNLEVGVSEVSLVTALQSHAEAMQKRVKVHLHVDTGMSRLGCRPEDVLSLAKEIVACPNLILEGIFTHFAAADDPAQDAFTHHQAKLLQNAIDELEAHGYRPRWRHACNSSAALRFGFSEFNLVRLGIAAYGFQSSTSSQIEALRPAISLVSRIVGINNLKKGDTISYGRDFTVEKEHAKIAVLPIGYYDGLHRKYSGKGYVLIHGKKAPMVGRICMDYMMVDISDIPEAKIGDQALLFGEDASGDYIAPEELAASGGSIVHELMTCLGPRIRRFFIYDESLRAR